MAWNNSVGFRHRMPSPFSNSQNSRDWSGNYGPPRPQNREMSFGSPRFQHSAPGRFLPSRQLLPNPQFQRQPTNMQPFSPPMHRMPPSHSPRPNFFPRQEQRPFRQEVRFPAQVPGPRMHRPMEPVCPMGLPWYQGPKMREPQRPLKQRSNKRQENRNGPKKSKEEKSKPWMTDEIFAEIKKKRILYGKSKKDNKTDSWKEFRAQRNKVSALIKEAKYKGGYIVRKKKNSDDEEEDKTEKPFSCDSCDRAFVEQSELDTHLSQHVKCLIDGCQFEAHEKIVQNHKKMQHELGYSSLIMKLETQEEIEKWRNERKKNYPTIENVNKRKAEQAEKEARGEVLETQVFGSKKEGDVVATDHVMEGEDRTTEEGNSRGEEGSPEGDDKPMEMGTAENQ